MFDVCVRLHAYSHSTLICMHAVSTSLPCLHTPDARTHTRTHTHTHTHTRMQTITNTLWHTCMYWCRLTHTRTHTDSHTNSQAPVLTQTHTRMHTHAQTNTHTHTFFILIIHPVPPPNPLSLLTPCSVSSIPSVCEGDEYMEVFEKRVTCVPVYLWSQTPLCMEVWARPHLPLLHTVFVCWDKLMAAACLAALSICLSVWSGDAEAWPDNQ